MRKHLRNLLSFVLRFGLSAGLLFFAFRNIDIKEILNRIRNADPWLLAFSFAVFLLIYLVILCRWFLFIRGLGLPASFFNVSRFFAIGLAGNLVLPTAVGGDIIKTVGLCHHHSEKPKVVASVLLDRLSGFAGIVLMAVAVFPFATDLLADRFILFIIIGMGLVIIFLGVILFHEGIYGFFCRVFERLPRVKKSLMQIHYDVALLKNKRVVIYQAIGLSCVAQVLLAATFWLTAEALHEHIDFVYYLLFTPIICVATSMPSIGGVGVRESSAKGLFPKAGMNKDIAFSIGILNSAYMYIVGAFGGLFFLFTRSAAEKRESQAK